MDYSGAKNMDDLLKITGDEWNYFQQDTEGDTPEGCNHEGCNHEGCNHEM